MFHMVIWACPDCGATKDVVCPVCGADKKAGETCWQCGSEYSHTTCPDCGGGEVFFEEEPYNDGYVEKVRKILKTRDEPYLTYYELLRLVDEIMPQALPRVCRLDPIDILHRTQEGFKGGKKGFISAMGTLPGLNEELAGLIWEGLQD